MNFGIISILKKSLAMENRATEQQDRELFDRIAKNYAKKDETGSSSLARQYQLMFAVRGVLEEQKHFDQIIDIACGVGAPAKYLQGYYDQYLGIDYSKNLIEAARVFNQGNQKASFLARNIKKIEGGQIQEKGDLVLSIGALHHMTEIDEVVERLCQIAKPNAFFVAIEPQRANPFFQVLRWLRAKTDKSYSADQHFFSKKEFRELFERHRFTDIEIEYQGFFSPVFAQVVMKPQVIFIPLSKIAILLDRLLDKILPSFLKFLSWNIVVRAKFPKHNI